MTFSLAAASHGLAGLMPQPHPVTKLVMGLNFFMFLVSLAANYSLTQQIPLMGDIRGQVLYRLGARSTAALILGHEWWRLVMPIFLHGGLLHIAMNTWVMLDLGPPLEELYGSARYLFLYLTTGIFGFVMSTGWDIVRHRPALSIGASGAIMGLAGLQLAISSQRGGAYFQMLRASLTRWLIIIFVIGLLPWFPVDNAAHAGGLISGFFFGRVFADREPADPGERRRAIWLALAALVVIIGSFAAMILHYSDELF